MTVWIVEETLQFYQVIVYFIHLIKIMTEKLPQIHKLNKSEIQSPFRYPSDEEVFLFRENDRKKQD